MPNGNPREELQGLKIAALGNFFDNNAGLPPFFSNCQTFTKAEFENGIEITGEQLQPANGQNTLIKHDDGNNRWTLIFDSESHVVMRWDDASAGYHYHNFYRNAPGAKARKLNLGAEQAYVGVRELENEANHGKITQVFSTQFSGCNLQIIFAGGNSDRPHFIIFSHLQNKSRLASILADLRCLATDILGIFNIAWPDVGSVTNCYHMIRKFPGLSQKSMTFLRDSYVWIDNTVQSGFGLALCGLQLEANASLRLAAIAGYSNIFGTATMLNLGLLPVFADTPVDIQNKIQQIRPLLTNYWVWRSKKQLKDELIALQNYYFSLFEQGKLADGSFVRNTIPNGEEDKLAYMKRFFELYNSEKNGANLRKLVEEANFDSPQKYIRWQNAVPIDTIIQQIEAADLPNLDNLFVDLRVASIHPGNVRRNFGKLL